MPNALSRSAGSGAVSGIADVPGLQAALDAKLAASLLSAPNGVAGLDSTGTLIGGERFAIPDNGTLGILDQTAVNAYDARNYAVKADARRVIDAVITAGSLNHVTSLNAAFTSADVGKTIALPMVGAASAPLVTTISSIVSATEVIIATAASTATTGPSFCAIGTDDTAALSRGIEHLASLGGGHLALPRGLMVITSAVRLRSYVSLFGQGMDATGLLFCSTDPGALTNRTGPEYSEQTPMTGVTLRDFEIDGRCQSVATYNFGPKCLNISKVRRCHFIRLKIHDSVGSALSLDFSVNSSIRDCLVYNGGRFSTTADPFDSTTSAQGGAGLGIGSGIWDIEDLTISGNHIYNCHNWGIFVEQQSATAPGGARGARIIDNVVIGGGQLAGIGDRGGHGLLIANNIVLNTTGPGIRVNKIDVANFWPEGGIISDNFVEGAAYEGIRVEVDTGPYRAQGNRSRNNKGAGISVVSQAGYVAYGVDVEDNTCTGNGGGGIILTGTGTLDGASIHGGRLENNGTLESKQPGVLISGDAPRTRVRNVIAGDRRVAGSKTQSHGVLVTGGARVIGTVVTDNDLRFNDTADVDLGSGLTTGAITARNP